MSQPDTDEWGDKPATKRDVYYAVYNTFAVILAMTCLVLLSLDELSWGVGMMLFAVGAFLLGEAIYTDGKVRAIIQAILKVIP